MSREAKKAEQRLKALLKEPANKRCVNCDSLGPQYVVSSFNVFVCTVCSGVHRQFGHRVKGVSMSTFKPEEVAALADSGNARFAAYYLHKWTTAALPKPVDRDVHRIHTWIGAVYQDRKFYGEPAGGWTPTAGAAASTTSTEGHEPVVRPLSEVLGSDAPRLHVQGSGSGLERSISAVSSTAGASTPSKAAAAANGTAAAAGGAAAPSGLLDLSSPKSAKAAAPAAAAWDPFGEQAQAAAAASGSPAAAHPAVAPAAEAGWAAFGDAPASPMQRQQQQQPAAAAAAPAAAKEDEGGSWEAFGSGPSSPAAAAEAPAAAPAAAAAAAAASAGAGTAPSAAGSSPPKPRQPVRSTSRPEVPMDVFYPEFEQIRSTGMLPTGKPVPLPPFPLSYSHSAGHPAGHPGAAPPPVGAQPFKSYSYPTGAAPQQQQQQQQQHMAAGGYGAPQRPTIAIPPAPLQPGFGYSGVSPSGRPGMPSPGAYSSSGYSPAGSIVSPAGSGFSSAVSHPGTNGSVYGSFTHQDAGAAALRSSAGSLSDLMPGSAAPTPSGAAPAYRLGEAAVNDPFAGLAPGLRSALPAVPQYTSSGRFGAAPPPNPAGGPPFAPVAANGGTLPPGSIPVAGPFAGAPAAAPAGMAPATAAASATLFGRNPSLTGYDLSAPAAPKPAASGNPFA